MCLHTDEDRLTGRETTPTAAQWKAATSASTGTGALADVSATRLPAADIRFEMHAMGVKGRGVDAIDDGAAVPP